MLSPALLTLLRSWWREAHGKCQGAAAQRWLKQRQAELVFHRRRALFVFRPITSIPTGLNRRRPSLLRPQLLRLDQHRQRLGHGVPCADARATHSIPIATAHR